MSQQFYKNQCIKKWNFLDYCYVYFQVHHEWFLQYHFLFVGVTLSLNVYKQSNCNISGGFWRKRQAPSKIVVYRHLSKRSLLCRLSSFNYQMSREKRRLVRVSADIAKGRYFNVGVGWASRCGITDTATFRCIDTDVEDVSEHSGTTPKGWTGQTRHKGCAS